MPVKLENVGMAVRNLDATIASFTDLGLTVLGRDTVRGEWTDTAVGLDDNHADRREARLPLAARRGDLRGRVQTDFVRGPSGIIVMFAEALKET